MADLIGFISASKDTAKSAASLFTIYNGTSPFQNGVSFTVSAYDFVVTESIDFATNKKSQGSRPHPVLVTSIGNLFVSSLRDKYDKDGNVVEADGDLNKHLREIVTNPKAKTDGEIMQALVDFCKDKTLVVRRGDPFTTTDYKGREKKTALVNIDIKED